MSAREENALSLATGTELEEYRIEGILGKGGFAITYSGLDLRLNKRVAIKELMPDGIATRIEGTTVVAQTEALRPDYEWAIDSFIKEAQTIAGFEHPNIVRVSRFFRKNGTAYMVMPFIEGSDLKRLMKARGKFGYQDLLAILLPLLGGLGEVHKAGVLHRDIKPENIYLTNHGVPILIDFGAARQQVGGKSLDVTSIITPGYAAIEQYSTDAKYQGPWSDIYSMAACIYHMITGQKPVPASERSDAARNHQPDPLPLLSQLNPPGYPPQFLHGVDQALQMGERQRPQNIETWIAMLGCAGSSASSIVHPPGGPSVGSHDAPGLAPASPTTQNKSPLLLALVLVLLVALLGVGGFAWYKLKEEESPDDVVVAPKPPVNPPPEVPVVKPPKDQIEDPPEVPVKPVDQFQSELNDLEVAIRVGEYDKAQRMIRDLDLKELSLAERRRLAGLRDLRDEEMKNCPAWLVFEGDSGIAVTIGGKQVRPINGRYRLTGVGKHSVTFSREGYDSRSDFVEVHRKDQVIGYGNVTLRENAAARMAREKAEKEAAKKAGEKEISDFARDYYRRLPSNDLNVFVGLFAERVDYQWVKGHLASKSELKTSFKQNNTKWPTRTYTALRPTRYEFLNSTQTEAQLSFSYSYFYRNSKGDTRNGQADDTITIQKIGGSWLITKWRQSVIRK